MTVYPEFLVCRHCKQPISLDYEYNKLKSDDMLVLVVNVPTRLTPGKALRRDSPEHFRSLYVTICAHCKGILGTSNFA